VSLKLYYILMVILLVDREIFVKYSRVKISVYFIYLYIYIDIRDAYDRRVSTYILFEK